MSMEATLTFCDIRSKEVVNVNDGRRLSRPIDMVFDCRARVKGIVVPAPKKSLSFKKEEDIFIPWNAIIKIGDDVILVNLGQPEERSYENVPEPPVC